MLWTALALAADPVHWATLNPIALDAYDQGPGAGAHLDARATRSAARTVPVGPTSVRVEAQLGETTQRQWLAALEVPLGLGVRERRYWTGAAAHRDAALAADRWRWVQEVQDLWGRWWTAATLAEHLEHHAASVDEDLARYVAAADEGLIAPLALEDLRAESVQVALEASTLRAEAAATARALTVRLGDVALTLDEAVQPTVNPWTELVRTLPDSPAVHEAELRAESARRRAGWMEAARTPTLAVGPMWAPDAKNALVPFAYAGVTVPLQPGIRSEARQARGEAAAAEADARWARHLAEERLRTEADQWELVTRRLDQLDRDVLGPLEARQDRLEAAFSEGLVTADRLVRGRRELHEAEHTRVRLIADLLASGNRAALVTTERRDR